MDILWYKGQKSDLRIFGCVQDSISKYDQEVPQSHNADKPWHNVEETQNTISYMT